MLSEAYLPPLDIKLSFIFSNSNPLIRAGINKSYHPCFYSVLFTPRMQGFFGIGQLHHEANYPLLLKDYFVHNKKERKA